MAHHSGPDNGDGDGAFDRMSMDLPDEMFRTGETAEEATILMQRRVVGPVFVDAQFSEVDGQAVFEGDIILGPVDVVRGIDDPGDRGIGIVGEEFRWPGTIPYEVEPGLEEIVAAAIEHWETHTPFRFVERTDEENFLSFEDQGGCSSWVGRQGGKQVISLGPRCSLGSAIHEIGHALGLWHEQSRSDRDGFVEVIMANIKPEHRHNFNKHIQDGEDLGDYDFGSIMHYPAKAFSANGQDTIVTRGGEPIGQREGLSQGDIGAIRLMYPDLDWDEEEEETAVQVDPGGDE